MDAAVEIGFGRRVSANEPRTVVQRAFEWYAIRESVARIYSTARVLELFPRSIRTGYHHNPPINRPGLSTPLGSN